MKISKKSMKYLNSCRKMDACVCTAVDAHIETHKSRLLSVFGKAKVQAWYEDEVDFMQQQMEDGCMAEEALYMLENPSGVLQSVPGYGIIQYEKHKSVYDRISGWMEYLPVYVHSSRKKAGQFFRRVKEVQQCSIQEKGKRLWKLYLKDGAATAKTCYCQSLALYAAEPDTGQSLQKMRFLQKSAAFTETDISWKSLFPGY